MHHRRAAGRARAGWSRRRRRHGTSAARSEYGRSGRTSIASIEPIAEETMLRLLSGTTLGAPVVPPVGSSATIRSGSATSRVVAFGGRRRASRRRTRRGRPSAARRCAPGSAPLRAGPRPSRRGRRARRAAATNRILAFDRVDLRGDRLAGEQQVERLHDGRTHRGPIDDRRRGAIGREHGDDVVAADAVAPQPSRRGVEQPEKLAPLSSRPAPDRARCADRPAPRRRDRARGRAG